MTTLKPVVRSGIAFDLLPPQDFVIERQPPKVTWPMNTNGNRIAPLHLSALVVTRLAYAAPVARGAILQGLRAVTLALAVIMMVAPAITRANPGYAAVEAVGALNGVALHCRYLDQVSRMKEAVVANAPKERSYGLAFEEATNEAFLSMIEQTTACPSRTRFADEVEAAIRSMEKAFARD